MTIKIRSFWVSGYDNEVKVYVSETDIIIFKGSDELIEKVRQVIQSDVEAKIKKLAVDIEFADQIEIKE